MGPNGTVTCPGCKTLAMPAYRKYCARCIDAGVHLYVKGSEWITCRIAADQCNCCGHHEIGVILDGGFEALRVGDIVKVRA